MKYVAIGPMKGKSYKINNSLKVVDGEIEVSPDTHKHFGHVLRADYALVPEHELPPEEPKPAGEPPAEQTVVDAPIKSGKGRGK